MNMSFSVRVEKGVAVIGCRNGETKMRFIGASCTASVKQGTDGLDSVTLAPMFGKNAVVALSFKALYSGQKAIETRGLVSLYWKDGKLFVSEHEFVSLSDRLGQVEVEGILSVTTNGMKFMGSDIWTHREKEEAADTRDIRLVNDTGRLCRYLVGEATLEELEADATDDRRRADQIRIASMQSTLDQMNSLVTELQEEVQLVTGGLQDENVSLRRQLGEMTQLKEGLQKDYNAVNGELGRLKTKLSKKLGARLRRFWCRHTGHIWDRERTSRMGC